MRRPHMVCFVCFAGSNLKGIASDVGFLVLNENSKLTLALKYS